jgi:hypothetical protein
VRLTPQRIETHSGSAGQPFGELLRASERFSQLTASNLETFFGSSLDHNKPLAPVKHGIRTSKGFAEPPNVAEARHSQSLCPGSDAAAGGWAAVRQRWRPWPCGAFVGYALVWTPRNGRDSSMKFGTNMMEGSSAPL